MKFIEKMLPEESPIDLLINLSRRGEAVVVLLKDAIEDYFTGKFGEGHLNRVISLERESDEIKLKLKKMYLKMKYTYFEKDDFLYIVHKADEILDLVRDIVIMLDMNRVEDVPENIKELFAELVENVLDTIRETTEAIEQLRTLAESGFSPFEKEKEEREISRNLGKKLYSLKNSMNPIDLMFLSKVARLISKIADQGKDITKRINSILR
jgi:predicted phosphate transport protein (TIGR00153 family)